jgi:hypothetical protein
MDTNPDRQVVDTDPDQQNTTPDPQHWLLLYP